MQTDLTHNPTITFLQWQWQERQAFGGSGRAKSIRLRTEDHSVGKKSQDIMHSKEQELLNLTLFLDD